MLKAYEEANEVQVSNINFGVISLKYRLGKLDLGKLTPEDILIAAKRDGKFSQYKQDGLNLIGS